MTHRSHDPQPTRTTRNQESTMDENKRSAPIEPSAARLSDTALAGEAIRRLTGAFFDPRRIGGELRRIASDLLAGAGPASDDELRQLLTEWAGRPFDSDPLAGKPLPPTGELRQALVDWKPGTENWTVRLVGWCEAKDPGLGALRRQATWELPWDELPDAIRALVIRGGKRAGTMVLVHDPELAAEAGTPPNTGRHG